MTTTIQMPDAMHAAAVKRVRELGFRNLSAYLRWKLDEDLTIAAYKAKERERVKWKNVGHSTYMPDSIRSRVMELRVGQAFTVDDILGRNDDRASASVTLHYMHRAGVIGLKSFAKRTKERGGWEPAVFVRINNKKKEHSE